MFTMLGTISEFERDLIKDRTAEGRECAKAQGKHKGGKSRTRRTLKRL